MFEVKTHVRAALSPTYRIEEWDNPELSPSLVLATDRRTGQRVVVKFHDTSESTVEATLRFHHEISATIKSAHPNVIPVLDSKLNATVIFYVMPLVGGSSLWTEMRNNHRRSTEEVVNILLQVSDALRHAHSNGIVHRDIQAGNILMDGPHATIIDFGLSTSIRNQGDTWVDIASLGEVGYELLTGANPYGKDQSGVGTMPIITNLTHVSVLRPDLPPGLGDILMRTMNSTLRWISVGQVYTALEPYA